jgi:hypothetical protein
MNRRYRYVVIALTALFLSGCGGDSSLKLEEEAAKSYSSLGEYQDVITRYPQEGLSEDHYVVYYPKDAVAPDTPVVLFLEGGGDRPKIDDYRGVMEFMASQGYFVIGAESGESYDSVYAASIFEKALDVAKGAHGLTFAKLAVMGHSQGGGQAFYVMKYFQDQLHGGYGGEGSLVVSIDGWFAFSMNQADLQALQGDIAFIQMNGLEGTGNDPRIYLSIWNLANQMDKMYLTLPQNDHGYVYGGLDELLENKKDLLYLLGALTDDTFRDTKEGYTSILDARKTTYDTIEKSLHPQEQYSEECNGTSYNARETQLKYNDIDYCAYETYL